MTGLRQVQKLPAARKHPSACRAGRFQGLTMNKRERLDLKALDLKQRTTEALRIADHALIVALEREIDELRARVEALENKR